MCVKTAPFSRTRPLLRLAGQGACNPSADACPPPGRPAGIFARPIWRARERDGTVRSAECGVCPQEREGAGSVRRSATLVSSRPQPMCVKTAPFSRTRPLLRLAGQGACNPSADACPPPGRPAGIFARPIWRARERDGTVRSAECGVCPQEREGAGSVRRSATLVSSRPQPMCVKTAAFSRTRPPSRLNGRGLRRAAEARVERGRAAGGEPGVTRNCRPGRRRRGRRCPATGWSGHGQRRRPRCRGS
ncbi:MAG: hypothetical protein BWZ02_02302 [Lentisphaerae bacterium ADurb.BinA184]|nr:MAG: hypothetical protein BWZ02_02302 [Lentisphaerae bacterium ADurb.BinA184]